MSSRFRWPPSGVAATVRGHGFQQGIFVVALFHEVLQVLLFGGIPGHDNLEYILVAVVACCCLHWNQVL